MIEPTRVLIVFHPTIPDGTVGVVIGPIPMTGTVEVTYTLPRQAAITEEMPVIYLEVIPK